jgi:uncharacterized protein involved in exopolysaccharide biosynthesis
VDREITIRDYLNVAWSGRWLILVTTVIGIIVGILVSVAHTGAYAATSRVTLGQPTSTTGQPLQTPYTSSQTATGALDITGLSDATAHALGVPNSVVRGHVHVSTPPGISPTIAAPAVLIVSASNAHPAMAISIANAFATALVQGTGASITQIQATLVAQAAQARQQIAQLTAQIHSLQASTGSNPSAAVALASATQQLSTAQTTAANAQLALAQANLTEAPRVLAQAYTASSSNTAPKRLQSIVLAGLIGLLVGLIATFIWRGSPAARASDA